MEYEYIGTEPCRMGSALILPGTIMEMAQKIDKNWRRVGSYEPPKPIPIIKDRSYPNISKEELEGLRDAVIKHTQCMTTNITVVPRDCVSLYNIVKKDDTVLEFASGQGQTTSVLLYRGVKLTACEMDLGSLKILRKIADGRATIIEGPIASNADKLPEEVDVLVIDAEHFVPCVQWYIEHLWPRVKIGGHIWFHDMRPEFWVGSEYAYVMSHIDHDKFIVVEHSWGMSNGVEGWDSIPRQGGGSKACSMILRRVPSLPEYRGGHKL